MKITIKEDFRSFKKDTVYDFSHIDTIKIILLVSDNGIGKSTLIHSLRGTKNDNKDQYSETLLKDNYKKLASKIEVEHDYDNILYLDNIMDNGSNMSVAFDATSYLQSGGFYTKDKSHGQGTIIYLDMFINKYKDILESSDKTLLVFDEIDNGLSLKNQALFKNFINNMAYKYGCHVLIATHNVFLIRDIFLCFDLENNDLCLSKDYIEKQTGFILTKNIINENTD